MTETLRKLERLTEALTFPDVLDECGGAVEFAARGGTALMWPVMEKPHVQVTDWFISKGTELGDHKHEGHEWLHVYRGKLKVVCVDTEMELGPGQYIYIHPGESHRVLALEDTWVLCVNIPPEQAFNVDGA